MKATQDQEEHSSRPPQKNLQRTRHLTFHGLMIITISISTNLRRFVFAVYHSVSYPFPLQL